MNAADKSLRDFLRAHALFEGFSEYQFEQVLPLIEGIKVEEGHYIIHENEISDNIYIVKEGLAAIERWDEESQQLHRLATLGAGSVIGEMSILDHSPRSASVRIIQSAELLILPVNKLYSLSNEHATYSKIINRLSELAAEAKTLVSEASLYPLLIQNIAKNLGSRLRSTNDAVIEGLRRDLKHEKARSIMGKLIITVICILSVYIVVLKLLEELHYQSFGSTVVSAPLIAVIGIIVLYAIAKTGYPLRYYGLTFRGWRVSVKESLMATVFMLLLMVLFKWILIHTTDEYANSVLFELKVQNQNGHQLELILMLLIYLLFVPLQELIVRGALQSSFQELLMSPHKTVMAILLSNLLFSVTHFHISIVVGLSVFLPGLVWGWLYSRHRTLVGVSLSHQIFGIWALMIVGV